MSIQKTWMNDWETFILEVGELFGRGLDDRTVAAKFAGKRVVWSGVLSEKRFRSDRAGVQMDMPPVAVHLPDGRRAQVDYLFLKLKAEDVHFWNDIPIGTTLRFATQISQSIGAFSAIEWCDTDEDNNGVITLATDGAVPSES